MLSDNISPEQFPTVFRTYSSVNRIDRKYDFKDFNKATNDILTTKADIDYLQVEHEDVTFFADITPIDNIEMQAGLVFPENCWATPFHNALAGALVATGTIKLPFETYREAIAEIATIFSVFSQNRNEE